LFVSSMIFKNLLHCYVGVDGREKLMINLATRKHSVYIF